MAKPTTKSKYQNFKVKEINRKDIKNAPYNPRKIDGNAKLKLRKSIEEHGMQGTFVWNERTGNLVSGHQRLEQLDCLENRENYKVLVTIVDVDEKEEATINVLMNNPALMGDWDIDKLADMKIDYEIDFIDMGFDDLDVDFLFEGDERFSELFDTPEVEQEKEKIQQVRRSRGQAKERLSEENKADFYSMLVFESQKAKEEFYKRMSVPAYEDVLTVEQLERAFKQ